MTPRQPFRDSWRDAQVSLRRLLNMSGADELSAEDEARLVRNMASLIDGLKKIARRSEHIELWTGPEDSLGAGSFDLYPVGDRRIRFVIEEQYVGTDWTDPDRRAVAWNWRAERLATRRDGTSRWEATAGGRVESDNVTQLLQRAGDWARRVNQTAQWTDSLGRTPSTSRSQTPELGRP